MKRRALIVAPIILLLFIHSLNSQENGKKEKNQDINENYITLTEFIQRTTKKDPYFQQILIDQLYLKYNKDLQLPASDIVLNTTIDYSLYVDQVDNYRKGMFEGGIGLSRLFPTTGTKISADYAVRHTMPENEHLLASSFNVRISQAIAKNAFGNLTKLKEKKIELENDIARHQIVEAYEDYLASLIQVYTNWLSAYEDFQTADRSLNYNKELLQTIRQKQRYGVAHPEEVDKMSLEVASSRENLLIQNNNYERIRNQIMQLTGDPIETPLKPRSPNSFEQVNSILSTDIEDALSSSRTYKMHDLMIKKGLLAGEIAEDNLLPSAEVFLGYEILGKDYRIRSPNREVTGGFLLSFPFGNQVAGAEQEVSRIERSKEKIIQKSNLLALETDLRNLKSEIENEKTLHEISAEKIVLAKRILTLEKNNYLKGRSSINQLIDARDNLQLAQYDATKRKVHLTRLVLEWKRRTDTLVDKTIMTEGRHNMNSPEQPR